MLRIIIADDHPFLRAGLVQIINKEVDMKVIKEVESGEELISQIMSQEYDLAILDIGLPGRNGIDTLQEIRKFNPNLPVIILSAQKEERFGVRAIKAGANAFISKEDQKVNLIEAIRRTKGGKKYITPRLAEILANNLDGNVDKLPHENLSNRELEVLHHIAKGISVSEIAEKLSLSVNTINTYRARILEKLGLESNTQIAMYALENGLLD